MAQANRRLCFVSAILGAHACIQYGVCEYVKVHTILGGSPVILWISLGDKPKWLPLKFGYHDVMGTSPIIFKPTAHAW